MPALLADLGGSFTRCALAARHGPLRNVETFANDEFASAAALLAGYLATLSAADRPHSGFIAVAAPVFGDRVQMVNRGWEFSREHLRAELRLDSLAVINDFAAQAWAVSALSPSDSVAVGGGANDRDAPCAVLGPGTGLGVAALIRVNGHWHVLPGEGGHVSLPALDPEEDHVVRVTRERFGHCSAERILSGPGLTVLHSVLNGEEGHSPAAIGAAVLAGSPAARKTFEMFFRMLGTVAADLALTLGAFGGVYVTGGIVPRYIELMRNSGFRERFEAKGRYAGYLARIATRVVTIEMPGLHGLRNFAASRGEAG